MKWFVWLFSSYLLLLSCVPCNAEDKYCIDEVIHSDTGNSNEEQRKPCCPCSPLFACSSCHAVIPKLIEVKFINIHFPVLKLHFFYTEQDLNDFPFSIWQPPKIG